MKLVAALDDLRRERAGLPSPVGLVPTMGALHEGHLSLVRGARDDCASVVVSIFVNPTQFGPGEDLAAYPRELEHDLRLLESAGVDLVWAPDEGVMYPAGFQTWVTVEDLTQPLEGAHRPGHFRGVTTVVVKLFNAVQPDRAYFGQKDAQQVIVIQRMVADLNFPLLIDVLPTVREPDGLALSSRNAYLNREERRAAASLYRALAAAQKAFDDGQRDAEALRARVREILQAEPLAKVEYVSAASLATLEELHGPVEEALVSLAVRIGRTRLIDNVVLGREDDGRRTIDHRPQMEDRGPQDRPLTMDDGR